jgi:hypothetical protein
MEKDHQQLPAQMNSWPPTHKCKDGASLVALLVSLGIRVVKVVCSAHRASTSPARVNRSTRSLPLTIRFGSSVFSYPVGRIQRVLRCGESGGVSLAFVDGHEGLKRCVRRREAVERAQVAESQDNEGRRRGLTLSDTDGAMDPARELWVLGRYRLGGCCMR